MSEQSRQRLTIIVADAVKAMAAKGQVSTTGIDGETDLFAAGVIDSFGFFDLIEELENRVGSRIEFETLDDSDIGTINGLVRQIARVAR